MKKTSFSAIFQVSASKARKNGKSPINLIITLNGQRASVSLHKFVNVSEWDNARQRVRGSSEEAKTLNAYLQQVKVKLLRKETELLEKGYIITSTVIRDAFLDRIASLQAKTLRQIYRDFLGEMEKQVGVKTSEDTYYCYLRTFNLVVDFMTKVLNRDDVQLFELNYTFIERLDTFLRTEYSQSHNTVMKNLKCLKHVINLAVTDGYLQTNPFAAF